MGVSYTVTNTKRPLIETVLTWADAELQGDAASVLVVSRVLKAKNLTSQPHVRMTNCRIIAQAFLPSRSEN